MGTPVYNPSLTGKLAKKDRRKENKAISPYRVGGCLLGLLMFLIAASPLIIAVAIKILTE